MERRFEPVMLSQMVRDIILNILILFASVRKTPTQPFIDPLSRWVLLWAVL